MTTITPEEALKLLRDALKNVYESAQMRNARRISSDALAASAPEKVVAQQVPVTKSLAATVADALRPFCRDGQEVIWRLALRWHGDNGPLPNRYNGMSIRSLSQFGLEVIADCGQAAIIAALPGAEK